jgi:ketol-acid reductoisomerase
MILKIKYNLGIVGRGANVTLQTLNLRRNDMNSSWLSHSYIYTYVYLYICIHIYMYVYLFIYDVGIVGRGANVTLQTLNLRSNNIAVSFHKSIYTYMYIHIYVYTYIY